MNSYLAIGKKEILKRLPHGEPCILISNARICSPASVEAELTCTGDEFYFEGHYKDNKILPGHILIEAMGQTGALLAHDIPELRLKTGHLVTIERMRFKKILVPPFKCLIEVRIKESRMNLLWLHCMAIKQDKQTVAKGILVIHFSP